MAQIYNARSSGETFTVQLVSHVFVKNQGRRERDTDTERETAKDTEGERQRERDA